MTEDVHEFLTCSVCGIRYGLPSRYVDIRRNSDNCPQWYCPNGHSQTFTETPYARVKRQYDILKQQMARIELEKNEAIFEKNKAERAMKQQLLRAVAGMCPCCKRTFQQLARHMKSKHPEIAQLPRSA